MVEKALELVRVAPVSLTGVSGTSSTIRLLSHHPSWWRAWASHLLKRLWQGGIVYLLFHYPGLVVLPCIKATFFFTEGWDFRYHTPEH